MSKLITETQNHDKHFTVTGYVMNKDRSKLLMIHHKKLDKWLPAGGHLESELPHEGAIREVYEETGVAATVIPDEDDTSLELKDVTDIQIPRPYALAYQLIPENSKDKAHIHLDMVYRLEADDNTEVSPAVREIHDVKWLTKDEILGGLPTFDSVIGFVKKNLI